jgi:hypothetical protein
MSASVRMLLASTRRSRGRPTSADGKTRPRGYRGRLDYVHGHSDETDVRTVIFTVGHPL